MATGSQTPIDNATVVWWDINRCPVPDDCNPNDVRPKIESALKNLCGSGPVTIFAMGDLHLIPREELAALTESQILMKHTELGLEGIYEDCHAWAKDHPPPSRMMLISGPGVIIHGLISYFEDKGYTFLRCYPCSDAPFLWENIMGSSLPRTLEVYDETSTDTQKTGVWWDIDSCPVPIGCDPSSIRGRIRTALDSMSVAPGPLTVYCMGNMKKIPRRQTKTAIARSGVSMIQHDFGIDQIFYPLLVWKMDNPPPATIMLISNVEVEFHDSLFDIEAYGYTVIRAYPTPDNSSQEISWANILNLPTSRSKREMMSREMVGREMERQL